MKSKLLTAAMLLAALMVTLIATGCQDSDVAWTEMTPGLSYADSLVGQGPAVTGDEFIVVHYTGWLWVDGKKGEQFDSTRERDEPIAFPLGRGMVIPGWEQGLVGMQAGGSRKLLIGHEMAYGEAGRPPTIPPSSTLMFEVELVELPEVQIEILTEGTGRAAGPGDKLNVHYTGWVWENGAKGEQFDSSRERGRPFQFNLGRGMVIPGWDMGFEGLKEGTEARLIIPPVMGYGQRGAGTIPPGATLCFEVELVSAEPMEIPGQESQ